MTEFVYSTNGEDFNDDFYSACDSAFNDGFISKDAAIKAGDITTIYQAEPRRFNTSDFFPKIDWVLESAQEMAYGEIGEYAEDWLRTQSHDIDQELSEMLKKTFQKWSDKHNLNPTFYGVKNTKEIKVKIVNFEGEYEEVADQAV